ncbi:GGDEF domain-containing protein, partial [Vibrio sp. FNV 38]|nr:GGDEF domain-containing protein [Vibrio sp. FNV 38]
LNHGEIETQLNNALAHRQEDGVTASVMMLDLDKFKDVNDNYGHNVGDTTLKHFAKVLLDNSTNMNVSVGRWGGEEFVIVCRDRNGEDTFELAEKIRKSVEAYFFPEIYHITCSIGVTELKVGDDFTAAFNRLDKA